ncbi:MAG: sulfite exporter TauE/SafE family protein [Bacteroidota bacterium]
MPLIITLSAIVLFATAIHAATGFGGTLLVVTLAALFYPLEGIIALIIPLNVLLNVYIILRYRQFANKKILVRSMIPYTFIGLLVGYSIYLYINKVLLGTLFASFIIILSCYELAVHFRLIKKGVSLSLFQQISILLGGGFLQGLFVSGGPLVVYYARKTIASKSVFRSTLAVLWIILNSTLLMLHLYKGSINSETLLFSATLMPALIAGTIIGEKVHHNISDSMFNFLIYLLIFLGGISLLLKNTSVDI